MAKQRGREMLLRVGTTAGGTTTYETVASLNSKSFVVNNLAIDLSLPPASSGAGWRQTETGLTSVSLSADGFADESTAEHRLMNLSLNGDGRENFEIFVPGLGTFNGLFRIISIEHAGATEAGVTFSIVMESADTITYTAGTPIPVTPVTPATTTYTVFYGIWDGSAFTSSASSTLTVGRPLNIHLPATSVATEVWGIQVPAGRNLHLYNVAVGRVLVDSFWTKTGNVYIINNAPPTGVGANYELEDA